MRSETVRMSLIAAAALLAAGCASVRDGRAIGEVRASRTPAPAVAQAADPNAFAGYGEAMSSDAKLPMAVEWQRANDAAIAAETAPERIRAILGSDEAERLLARIDGAYDADPMVATQIAACSQMAMCAKWKEAPQARARWTARLLAHVRDAVRKGNPYAANFFLDQLRWCGTKEDAKAVRAIAGGAGDAAVRDFAFQVARELAR